MADHIDKFTADQEKAYANKIRFVYKQAARDIKKEIADFTARHKRKDDEMREKVKSGQISEEDYQAWLRGQVFQGEQWKKKLDDIVKVYTNADAKAHEILGGTMRNVFTESANYSAYQIEKGVGGAVSFQLYDAKSVERLMRTTGRVQTLPEWKIDRPKDYTWNAARVRNTVASAIIQGKPIPDIASDLGEQLATSNARKMTLFARTAMTGAQNAGRMERLHETQDMGIKVKKKWLAAHDNHVREAHEYLDGQEREVDEPFVTQDGQEIMYPGDPNAAPELVYNCRCTLTYVYSKYQKTGEPDKSFEEWQEDKEAEQQTDEHQEPAYHVVQGVDIYDTWHRRAEQFDFEIDDVMDAQGFNGLPRVVGKDEFDELVRQANGGNGFIAQRTYSAPDHETLEAYREMLYSGKWYVDCSSGGSAYGQGMYSSSDYTGTLTDGLLQNQRAYQSSHAHFFTETFTLDPSAKIADFDELSQEMSDTREQRRAEIFEKYVSSGNYDEYEIAMLGSKAGVIPLADAIRTLRGLPSDKWDALEERLSATSDEIAKEIASKVDIDIGVYATLRGYDAIRINGAARGCSYTTVLNRSKMIILNDEYAAAHAQ